MAGTGAATMVIQILTEFEEKGWKQARKTFRQIEDNLQSISSFTQNQLVNSFANATRAITTLSKAVHSTGVEFEQSVQNVIALRNANESTGRVIEATARRLGSTTAYTATQVSEGMLELARAGLSTNKILGAIGPTLFLAGAQGASLAAAGKLMSRTFAQFSLDASEAGKVADTFTVAMQNSLLNMESLDTAMRYAGGSAGAYEHDVQETTAAVAQFMNITGLGSTAGTQFRQVLLSLGAPTRRAQEAMEDYKISMDALDPKKNNFAQIMENLKPMMNDTGAIVKLVSKRAAGSLQKLLKAWHSTTKGGEEYHALLKRMKLSAGIAEATYQKMIDTVGGQTTILTSKMEELFLTIFDSIKVDLKAFIKQLQLSVDHATSLFYQFGPVIEQSFGGLLRQLGSDTKNLDQIFANWLTKTIIRVNRVIVFIIALIGKFKNMIPVLQLLAKLMVSIWVATKVVAFIKIMGGLAAAVSAAFLAFMRLNAGIAAASTNMTMFRGIAAATSVALLGIVSVIGLLVMAFMNFGSITENTMATVTKSMNNVRAARDNMLSTERQRAKDSSLEDIKKQYDDIRDAAKEAVMAEKGWKAASAERMAQPLTYGARNDPAQGSGHRSEGVLAEGFDIDAEVMGRAKTEEELKIDKKLLTTINSRIAAIKKLNKAQVDQRILTGELIQFQVKYTHVKNIDDRFLADHLKTKQEAVLLDQQTAMLLEEVGVNFDAGGVNAQVEERTKKFKRMSEALQPAINFMDKLTEAGANFGAEATPEQWLGVGEDLAKAFKVSQEELEKATNDASMLSDSLGNVGTALDIANPLTQLGTLTQWLSSSIGLTEKLKTAFEGQTGVDTGTPLMDFLGMPSMGNIMGMLGEKLAPQTKNQAATELALVKIAEQVNNIVEGAREYKALLSEGTAEWKNSETFIKDAVKVQGKLTKLVSGGLTATQENIRETIGGVQQLMATYGGQLSKLQQQSSLYAGAIFDSSDMAKQTVALVKTSLKIAAAQQKAEASAARRSNQQSVLNARIKLEEKLVAALNKSRAKTEELDKVRLQNQLKQIKKVFDQEQKVNNYERRALTLHSSRYYRAVTMAEETALNNRRKAIEKSFEQLEKTYDDQLGNRMVALKKEEEAEKKKIEVVSKGALALATVGEEAKSLAEETIAYLKPRLEAAQAIVDKINNNKRHGKKQTAQNKSNIKYRDELLKQMNAAKKSLQNEADAVEFINDKKKESIAMNTELYGEKQKQLQKEFTDSLTTLREKFYEQESTSRKRELGEFIGDERERLRYSKMTTKQQEKFDNAVAVARKNLQSSLLRDFIQEQGEYTEEVIRLRRKLLNVEGDLYDTFLRGIKLNTFADERIDRIKDEIEATKELAEITKRQAEEEKEFKEGSEGMAKLRAKHILELDEYNKSIERAATLTEVWAKATAFAADENIVSFKDFMKTFLKFAAIQSKSMGMLIARSYFDLTKKSIDTVKNGLQDLVSFMTGGLNFNPFEAITEGVNQLIAAEEELQQKEDDLESQFRAGRISEEEYSKGKGAIAAEKKSAKDVGQQAVDDMVDRAVNFVNKIVEMAPIVLKRLGEKLPMLLNAISRNLPRLLTILSRYIPPLITMVVNALADSIPVVLNTIIKLLPDLIPIFVDAFKQIAFILINNIDLFIKLGTQVIVGVVEALPDLITAFVDAIPDILKAVADSMDIILIAILDILPEVFIQIGKGLLKVLTSFDFYRVLLKILTAMIIALFAVLSGASLGLAVTFGLAVVAIFIKGIGRFIKDMLAEIKGLLPGVKNPKTKTFGDTPGPQFVPKNSAGLAARFAPGDYVIAAKEPSELVRQSLQAMGSQLNKGANRPPAMPLSPEKQGSGGAISTNIAIVAEGRLLDAVQVTAMERGHAPKMSKRLRKASGVKVGFDRGNYQKYAVNSN